MEEEVRKLLAVVLQEEVVKTTKLSLLPSVGQVAGGGDVVDLHVVLVVLFVALSRLPHEAEPNTPLVPEGRLHHLVH